MQVGVGAENRGRADGVAYRFWSPRRIVERADQNSTAENYEGRCQLTTPKGKNKGRKVRSEWGIVKCSAPQF